MVSMPFRPLACFGIMHRERFHEGPLSTYTLGVKYRSHTGLHACVHSQLQQVQRHAKPVAPKFYQLVRLLEEAATRVKSQAVLTLSPREGPFRRRGKPNRSCCQRSCTVPINEPQDQSSNLTCAARHPQPWSVANALIVGRHRQQGLDTQGERAMLTSKRRKLF